MFGALYMYISGLDVKVKLWDFLLLRTSYNSIKCWFWTVIYVFTHNISKFISILWLRFHTNSFYESVFRCFNVTYTQISPHRKRAPPKIPPALRQPSMPYAKWLMHPETSMTNVRRYLRVPSLDNRLVWCATIFSSNCKR